MGNLASAHLPMWERAWREAPGGAGFVGGLDFTRQRKGGDAWVSLQLSQGRGFL